MKTLITFISQYDPIGVEFVDTKQDNVDGRQKRFRPNFGQDLTVASVEDYENDDYNRIVLSTVGNLYSAFYYKK